MIGYLGGDRLLRLIGATDANLALARDYGFIIYAMLPFALVQNTLASIIRADAQPIVGYNYGAGQYARVCVIVGRAADYVCIARSDTARSAYYKSISGREWGDPHEYELCVDNSTGAEATAGLICDYFSHRQ